MKKKHLNVLWTNGDLIAAEKMVLMYTQNSVKRSWWDTIVVYIWGEPAELIGKNENLREQIQEAMEIGVQFVACKACADELGVTQELESIGIDVQYIGELITNIIRSDEYLITI